MEVILVKPVRKWGKVGDKITVANGYGRNYLIPQKFAVRATKENIDRFVGMQKDLEAKNLKEKEIAQKAAGLIKNKHINFITQSAVDGRLFGSVSAKQLAVEISKLAGITLNYSSVLLDTPIKFNGVYNIQIVLHPEVITNIFIVVAKSEPEAQDTLKEYKEEKDNIDSAQKDKELELIEKDSVENNDD